MAKPYIRMLYRDRNGTTTDAGHDFDIDDDFSGVLPVAGDRFLDKGVVSGLDRSNPRHRRVLTVVERVFNARDSGYIALVVTEAPVAAKDEWMMP